MMRLPFVFALGLLAWALLSGCQRIDTPAAAPPSGRRITAVDINCWCNDPAWKSREQLFHLFVDLLGEVDTPAVADPSALAAMRERLTGFFPAQSIIAARVEQRRLHLTFTDDQTISIPNSFALAWVAMSRELVLRLDPLDLPAGQHGLAFTIESGLVRLEFSWLARLLIGEQAFNMGFDRLEYQVDTIKRTAVLSAKRSCHFPSAQLHANVVGGNRIEVDLEDPDFPGHKELVLTPATGGAGGALFLGKVRIAPPALDRITVPQRPGETAESALRAWFGEQVPDDLDYRLLPTSRTSSWPFPVRLLPASGESTTAAEARFRSAFLPTTRFIFGHIDAAETARIAQRRAAYARIFRAALQEPAIIVAAGADLSIVLTYEMEEDRRTIDADVKLRVPALEASPAP
ncbi:hypothetical protein LBMAG53_04330 [Planctomycetota bacterium]|nr:hypothetical protein LBMAG53_04330 [Planctomycetota bacterium]